jgi:hypothetical protein
MKIPFTKGLFWVFTGIAFLVLADIYGVVKPLAINSLTSLWITEPLLIVEIIALAIMATGGIMILNERYGWIKKKDSNENLSDYQLQGKIKHIENDLLPAYRRLIGLETEEKDSKLVFLVNPLHKRRKRNATFDEAWQEVWEMEHIPKTPLEVLTDGGSALEHLKHKDYNDIYQHFKKAEELVHKFNENHDELLKPQIDESVQNFRIRLVHLIDRLDNNHILKGKCSSCP